MGNRQTIWQFGRESSRSGRKHAAFALSVSLLMLLAVCPVTAQEAPTPPVNPPATTTTAPEAVKPAAPVESNTLTDADVALYKKAITSVQKSRGIQVVSDVTMLVEGQGLKVSIKEKIKITGKSPNKYRAELAILPPAQTAPRRFTVVSNGSKVFTHRPGMKQYAARPAARGGIMNPFETGLFFGFLVLGTGQEEMANLDALRKGGGAISVATDTLDSKEYRVFAISPPDNSFKMRFYVEPTTARIDQIEMRGKDNGQDIVMTERVSKQNLNARLTTSTFVFTPPKGTKKVPAIDVSDF